MKHNKHTDRKSFKKWAMPNQRVMTKTLAKKIVRRGVGNSLNSRNEVTAHLLALAYKNL